MVVVSEAWYRTSLQVVRCSKVVNLGRSGFLSEDASMLVVSWLKTADLKLMNVVL